MKKYEEEFLIKGNKFYDNEKDEEIDKHMEERGKLIIKVLFYNNYSLIFRISSVGTLKRLV
jgi:hypothetical protein